MNIDYILIYTYSYNFNNIIIRNAKDFIKNKIKLKSI